MEHGGAQAPQKGDQLTRFRKRRNENIVVAVFVAPRFSGEVTKTQTSTRRK